jgi:hypothetical protein
MRIFFDIPFHAKHFHWNSRLQTLKFCLHKVSLQNYEGNKAKQF